jgi:thiol:disulfide interchange protein
MEQRMKKFTLFLAIILIGTLGVFAQNSKTKKKTIAKTRISKTAKTKSKTTVEAEKFYPTANPINDLQATIVKAQKQNKRIILDVGGEWCSWCHEMDNFLVRNVELNKLRNENFLWLKINFSEENKNEAFLAKYPAIKGYPHLFVLEKDGTFIYSKDTSELEDGVKSYNLQKFTEFLNEYAPAKAVSK